MRKCRRQLSKGLGSIGTQGESLQAEDPVSDVVVSGGTIQRISSAQGSKARGEVGKGYMCGMGVCVGGRMLRK